MENKYDKNHFFFFLASGKELFTLKWFVIMQAWTYVNREGTEKFMKFSKIKGKEILWTGCDNVCSM